MELILIAAAYVAGIISCAVWLKVVPLLKAKLKGKVDELRD
jgi:hypothetical protein